ncbi:MAG: aminodeoxychorismate/anthranilate synthase component II [Pirellulaceae bacterium]|nr:aminodeoxychorismate/anthranilate synthase component II [Pirellulaceae bacterium]
MILLIDNYDSFVHNLARYLRRMGSDTLVVRNDKITVDWIQNNEIEAIVLSPGPCTPAEAGMSLEIVDRFWKTIPLLGVCLGHQTIAAAFGASIIRSTAPMHGRASQIHCQSSDLFDGLPNPLTVARYHSLVVDESTLPDKLRATAHARDGTLMAVEHVTHPIVGWQFHPESILTESGYELLARFFHRAGMRVPNPLPNMETEQRRMTPAPISWTNHPITF